MTWASRLLFWRKKQAPPPEPTEHEQVMLDLEKIFGEVEWLQSVINSSMTIMDAHYTLRHEYLGECDVMCAPVALKNFLHRLSYEDLYLVAILLTKNCFEYYAALRHEQSK